MRYHPLCCSQLFGYYELDNGILFNPIHQRNPNWWRRRTTLERCLVLISIFALIAVVGLVIGLVSVILSNRLTEELKTPASPPEALQGPTRPSENEVFIPPQKPTKEDVCLTAECIHTASSVLSKMKPDVEPCDNFYDFVCGTYIDEMLIPDDKDSVNTFSLISDKLHEQLKEIIVEERPKTEHKHFQLPNALYKSCMNKTLIEELDATPIANIAESLGGWPVIKGDAWNTDNSWNWQDTVKKFRKLGFSMDYIIDFSISVDLKNSVARIIDYDQSSIGLSREYLVKGFNETLVSSYYDYMVDIAVLFGADKERAKKELRESIDFEIALANISWPAEKRRNTNDLYNLRTIKQLQETYPYVQWLEYTNALLPSKIQVTEDEPVNLSVPSFFDALGPLLERTPNRVIANYMMWRIHAFSIVFLSEQFRKRQLQYATALSGRQEQEARWKECVDITSGSFYDDIDDRDEEIEGGVDDIEYEVDGLAIAVGSLYVRKHFNEDSKAIALDMVTQIRRIFDNMLSEVDWMDEATKAEAKKKLHSMATHIGYPDEMLDNAKLEEYYNNLDIDPNKYFESFLKMNVFGTDYSFNKLRLPVNKTDWVRHARPAVVNAYYSAIENSIQFPAGILQGHFFNAARPKYMNYGAIGFVIGHEITHGFDDQGRRFDLQGNLVDWWAENTQKAYLEKAACIIDQYGNYTDEQTGLHLNGINTQGENIADNGGVKESYRAYRQWVAKNGAEPKLPGLDYTPEQMFWISAGQTWCAKYRKETLKIRITTGVHSPSQFRVMGTFSNMNDFARDFNCPEGSRMNPLQKCVVW
ncbi:neprilysin-2 isoform X5 [Eurosta solidaginis]|uniref:neprilysin-2 isoform X5 n=1 Tax=Eurosta solidaginis TaxID=178769 RepID=UPI003530DD18